MIGFFVLAAVMGLLGVNVVWLGRRGRDGRIDFAMGHHKKRETDPTRWATAHEITGEGIIEGGTGFLLAAVTALIGPLIDFGTTATVVLVVVLAVVSTVWVLVSAGKGMAHLDS